MTTALSLVSLDLATLDRAALRKLYREVLGQPSDRSVLDRSSEMRVHLASARDEAVAAETARVEAEKAAAAAAPVVVEPPAEKKSRTGKWEQIVAALWDLRETPEAVEVKIPVEKMVEMGLPTSATTHPLAAGYWCANPPGIAARKLGLVPSLRKDRETGSRVLLLRKAE